MTLHFASGPVADGNLIKTRISKFTQNAHTSKTASRAPAGRAPGPPKAFKHFLNSDVVLVGHKRRRIRSDALCKIVRKVGSQAVGASMQRAISFRGMACSAIKAWAISHEISTNGFINVVLTGILPRSRPRTYLEVLLFITSRNHCVAHFLTVQRHRASPAFCFSPLRFRRCCLHRHRRCRCQRPPRRRRHPCCRYSCLRPQHCRR